MNNSRGSQWRRWDLHIHTKSTNKNDNYNSPSFDDFCVTLFKVAIESDIAAIGITDYFSIDNYKKVLDFQAKINIRDEFNEHEKGQITSIFLLPNVELRMFPVTASGKLINIHCIINPDYIRFIENNLFNAIEYSAGPGQKYKMNRDGFIQLGKALDNNLNDNQAYQKGLSNFVVSIDQLQHLLDTNKELRENIIIVVSNSNQDGASAIQKHHDLFESTGGALEATRQSIYHISDCIFSGNDKDVQYFLGNSKDDKKTVEKKCGSLKPCIHGSDAHSEDKLFMPDNNRFCWIKADLTFEGLKQIIYEPQNRVRIQEHKPDYKDDKLLIDKVTFYSKNNKFSPVPILLNPNLNVIIGGKSSGKSILLHLIAKSLLTNRKLLQNDDGRYKYDLGEDTYLKVKIASGNEDSSKRPDHQPSILADIKYIPQNYLSSLADPEGHKTGNELVKLIRTLLLEDETYKLKYDHFVEIVKTNDKKRDTYINNYFEIKEQIAQRNQELLSYGNEQVLIDSVNDNIKQVAILKEKSGLSSEQIVKYDEYRGEQNNLDAQEKVLTSDFQVICNFNTTATESLGLLTNKKDEVINAISPNLKEYIDRYYNDLNNALKSINELSTLIEIDPITKCFKKENCFKSSLAALYKRKDELQVLLKPFLANEELKKQISTKERTIIEDQQKIDVIQKTKVSISTLKQALIEEKTKIFDLYLQNHQEYEQIIGDLDMRSKTLANDNLEIIGKVRFNFPKFRKEMEAISDNRRCSYSKYPIFNDKLSALSDFDISEIKADLDLVFDAIARDQDYALTSRTSNLAATKVLLNDYFFDYWDVNYDNDLLGEMSTGKASYVILMLIIGLSKSKAPILIDQPEDNLDNRSISKSLVEYLRTKKKERQIILVTHNPNIVVNADAENVIVANQKGQNDRETTSLYLFDYINGAIEDTKPHDPMETDLLKSMGIKEHIADIVEGGVEAFEKREKKYGFKYKTK